LKSLLAKVVEISKQIKKLLGGHTYRHTTGLYKHWFCRKQGTKVKLWKKTWEKASISSQCCSDRSCKASSVISAETYSSQEWGSPAPLVSMAKSSVLLVRPQLTFAQHPEDEVFSEAAKSMEDTERLGKTSEGPSKGCSC